MSNFSRRSFLAGLSAIPLTLSLKKYVPGAVAPLVRHDVTSAQGLDMLATYAKAVKTMMNSPERSPIGWLFQWYIHSVRGDRSKTAEIARIYPTASPEKNLAQATWSTCQAHGLPEEFQKFFLPWHRMYLFYFEQIIRKVSGRSDFTLPYWNYSDPGVQSGPRLPSQFRMSGDATFGSLFVGKRNRTPPARPGTARVNSGEAIDLNAPGALAPVALEECDFASVDGVGGFSNIIDGGLHGTVHVLVGNTDNMGDVPWAAFDPIFWLHHCNIDRLWESWNRLGGKNLTSDAGWMGQKFTFADENGNSVQGAVKDFLDIAALGYSYQNLLTSPKPTCAPAPDPAALASISAPQQRATVTRRAIRLAAAPVRLRLDPTPPEADELQVTLDNRIRTLRPERRLYVVAKNVRAEVQPGVLYNLYLGLPLNQTPRAGNQDPHYVGTLNFFDAVGHGGDHEGAPAAKSLSINITQLVKSVRARRRIGVRPTLTIAPAGVPDPEAQPVIGEISLVER